MAKYFTVVQFILGVALILAILVQSKGSGLGSVFGSEGSVFRTRRGAEKTIFNVTIALAVAFFLMAVAMAVLTARYPNALS